MPETQQDREAVVSAGRYAGLRAPRRPRLAPWLFAVDLGDDRLQLRSAESFHTLAHPLMVRLFRKIEPLLDGNHTIEEIASYAESEAAPTTIVFLLNLLHGKGLLQPGWGEGELDSRERLLWDKQLRLLSHFTPDAETMQSVIARSCIGLLGSGELADEIRTAVEAVGVRSVVAVPNPPALQDYFPGLDLVIACADSPAFEFFEAVNRASLESGARWLRVCYSGELAQLGPTIVPHHSACFRCLEVRQQANQADIEGYRAYRKQAGVAEEGSISPFRSVVANQAALEVMRLLTAFAPPVTVGRFYVFGAATPDAVPHNVLKVPRCPACGRRRNFLQPWDEDFEAVECNREQPQ